MPRITQLPSLTTADNSDEIAIVDVSASTTKKITRGDLLKAPLPVNSVTTAAITDGAVTSQKIDFATFPSDTDWDSGWVTIPLVSPFSGSIQVRKIGGVVYLGQSGGFQRVATTAGQKIAATIPVGYRPSNTVTLSAVSSNSSNPWAARVVASGDLYIDTPQTTASDFTYVGGSYPAA